MSDNTEAQDLAWRRLWRIVHHPSPDIAVAMPWKVKLLKMGGGQHRVVWLGWNPSVGLMTGESSWHFTRRKPQPPIDEWTPFGLSDCVFRAKPLKRSGGAPFIELGGLPFPKTVDTMEPWIADHRKSCLRNNLFSEFTNLLPDNVSVCFDVLKQSNEDKFSRDECADWRALSYLLGTFPSGGVCVADAGFRRRRFVMSHPLLAGTRLRSDALISDCVDCSKDLTQSLAGVAGTEERVVRLLGRVPSEKRAEVSRFMYTPCCLALIEGMDPSWLSSLEGASRYVWEELGHLSWRLSSEPERYCRLFGAPRNLPFQRLASYLGSTLAPEKDNGFSWIAGIGTSWNHLDDAVREMARDLVLPALARTDSEADLTNVHINAMKSALCALGVRRLSRCLDDHLAGVVHDARLGWGIREGDADDGWGEAAPEAVSPQHLTLRFLGSQSELHAEGKALAHCVGSFGQSCANRSCAILSIGRWEARRWLPSSTVEVRLHRDGSLVVSQHCGRGNGHPHQKDRDALEWWLGQVRSGNVVLVPEAIRYAPRGNPSAHDLPLLLCAAWNTPEAHAHRWDRWRRLLRTRHATCGDWLMSLPPAYFQSYPDNAKVCELVVDLDAAMAATSH